MADTVKNTVVALDSISPESFNDEAARYPVKEAARRLLARMQTPYERAWDIATESPFLFAAVKVGIDLGVFEGWSKAGSGEASLEDLLSYCNTGCEANLLSRCHVEYIVNGIPKELIHISARTLVSPSCCL